MSQAVIEHSGVLLKVVNRKFEWEPTPRCYDPAKPRHQSWPAQRLLYPSNEISKLPEPFKHDDTALRRIIPEDYAALAEPFEAYQWGLLEALGSLPEAVELARDNPVLAYAVANNSELAGRSPTSGSFMAIRYFRGTRRKACAWLGFPESQAMVNLFKRIDPSAAHPSNLRMLRTRLEDDPELLARLNHLPRVTVGVMALAVMPEFSTVGSPRLLRDVVETSEEDSLPLTANLIQDWLAMLHHQGKPLPAFRIASQKRAEELHDEEGRSYQQFLVAQQEALEREQQAAQNRAGRIQHARQVQDQHVRTGPGFIHPKNTQPPFPLPPCPGTETILPITTVEELKQESLTMNNCVATYETRVRGGLIYIYRVLKPQRATLEISLRYDGFWRRAELKQQRNRAPTKGLIKAVDTWLWECMKKRTIV